MRMLAKYPPKTIKNALGLVVPVISEYKEISTKRIRLPQRKRIEHSYLDAQGMIELFEAIQGETVELPDPPCCMAGDAPI